MAQLARIRGGCAAP